jgi:hypothetical protein
VIIPQQQSFAPPPPYSDARRSESALTVPVAPVFMVPFQRDPKYLGRPATMDEIILRFKTQHRVALAGLGGVGYVFALVYC